MDKYEVTVLFKNGVEKKWNVETDYVGIESVKKAIEANYIDGKRGTINMGLIIVNLNETVCVEISKIKEVKENE